MQAKESIGMGGRKKKSASGRNRTQVLLEKEKRTRILTIPASFEVDIHGARVDRQVWQQLLIDPVN